MGLVAAYASGHRKPWHKRPCRHHHDDSDESGDSDDGEDVQWEKVLCNDNTTAEAFLNQTRTLISTLQPNGVYNRALQDRAQYIAYIQHTNNTELLSWNCTTFADGLKTAIAQDKRKLEQNKQNERIVNQLFAQIIQAFMENSNSDED